MKILFLLMWEMNYGAVQASINFWRSVGSAVNSRHVVRMSYSYTTSVDVFHDAASGIAEIEKKLSTISAENRLCQYLIRKLPSVNGVSSGSGFSLSDTSFEANIDSPVSEMLPAPVSALPISEIFIQPLAPSASQILSWLQVQDAGMKGKGLFSLQCIQEHTLLGEYLGEVLTQKEFSIRYPKGDAEYVFLVSEDVQRRDRIYVDAANETKSNIFRFINHNSLDPNVKVEVYFGEGKNNGHKKEDPLIDEDYAKTCLDLTNSDSEVKMNLHGGKDRKETKKPSKHRVKETVNFEIRMITSRVIEVGEELSFDYGPMYSPSNGWMGSVSL